MATVNGTSNNDTFSVSAGNGQDVFNGGAGTDTLIVDYSGATSAVTSSMVSWASIYYSDGINSVQGNSIERFVITGGSGNDSLLGDVGNDTLKGGAGDDAINSSTGVDSVDGGSGVDRWTADLTGLNTGVNVTLNADFTLSNGTRVTNVEVFNLKLGSGNDQVITITGSYNDSIDGGTGNDSFAVPVGNGRDVFNGGEGTDTLIVDYSGATSAVTSSMVSWASIYYSDGINSVQGNSIERFVITGGSGNDSLLGDVGNDTLSGGAGDDTLIGSSGDDQINGGAGNDLLNGQTGNDNLTGGEGLDTASYRGTRSSYSIQQINGVTTVSGSDEGADSLQAVERLKFSDGFVALDMDGAGGVAVRALGVAAGKSIFQNKTLVGQVIALVDAGASLSTLADVAVSSGFLASMAGGSDHTSVTRLLMRNVLGSDADQTLLADLVKSLEAGVYTQASLMVMAAQLDATATQIDLVGLSRGGLAYNV